MGNVAGKTLDVGGYRVKIRDVMGEGGFSYIFRVKEIAGPNMYALKRMVYDAHNRAMAVTAQREVDVLRRLPIHPNIVRLIASDTVRHNNGEVEEYLLLEYCAGGSMAEHIQQRHPNRLTETEIYEVAYQVALAVQHLHAQRPPIAHRDLKLENVLLGGDGLYKLCDFGSCTTISKVYETHDEMDIYEEEIEKNTTLAFRAPEMVDLKSRRRISEKVDIWALGCMIYTMAFYEGPFQNGGAFQISQGKYTIPSSSPYSADLHQLINSLLILDPEQRPSIVTVLDHITSLRSGKSLPRTSSSSSSSTAVPAAVRKGSITRSLSLNEFVEQGGTSTQQSGQVSSNAKKLLEWNADPNPNSTVAGSRPNRTSSSAMPPRDYANNMNNQTQRNTTVGNSTFNAAGLSGGGGGGAWGQDAMNFPSQASGLGEDSAGFGLSRQADRQRNTSTTVPAVASDNRKADWKRVFVDQALLAVSKQMSRWVIKCTNGTSGLPKPKYVRYIVIDAWKKRTVVPFYKRLYLRPVKTEANVAIKSLVTIHKVMLQGPPEAVLPPLPNSIVDGIQAAWSQALSLMLSSSSSQPSYLSPNSAMPRNNSAVTVTVEKNGNSLKVSPDLAQIVVDYASLLSMKLAFIQNGNMKFFDGNYSIDSYTNETGMDFDALAKEKGPEHTPIHIHNLSRLLDLADSLIALTKSILSSSSELWQTKVGILFALIDESEILFSILTNMMAGIYRYQMMRDRSNRRSSASDHTSDLAEVMPLMYDRYITFCNGLRQFYEGAHGVDQIERVERVPRMPTKNFDIASLSGGMGVSPRTVGNENVPRIGRGINGIALPQSFGILVKGDSIIRSNSNQLSPNSDWLAEENNNTRNNITDRRSDNNDVNNGGRGMEEEDDDNEDDLDSEEEMRLSMADVEMRPSPSTVGSEAYDAWALLNLVDNHEYPHEWADANQNSIQHPNASPVTSPAVISDRKQLNNVNRPQTQISNQQQQQTVSSAVDIRAPTVTTANLLSLEGDRPSAFMYRSAPGSRSSNQLIHDPTASQAAREPFNEHQSTVERSPSPLILLSDSGSSASVFNQSVHHHAGAAASSHFVSNNPYVLTNKPFQPFASSSQPQPHPNQSQPPPSAAAPFDAMPSLVHFSSSAPTGFSSQFSGQQWNAHSRQPAANQAVGGQQQFDLNQNQQSIHDNRSRTDQFSVIKNLYNEPRMEPPPRPPVPDKRGVSNVSEARKVTLPNQPVTKPTPVLANQMSSVSGMNQQPASAPFDYGRHVSQATSNASQYSFVTASESDRVNSSQIGINSVTYTKPVGAPYDFSQMQSAMVQQPQVPPRSVAFRPPLPVTAQATTLNAGGVAQQMQPVAMRPQQPMQPMQPMQMPGQRQGSVHPAMNVPSQAVNQEPVQLVATYSVPENQPGFGPMLEEWEIDPKQIRLGEKVGAGAFSEVYQASWRGTDVAVKKLNVQEINPVALRDITREVSTMIRLRHPNLVLFMGANLKQAPLCVVTEYCAGGNLFDLLHLSKVPLSWRQRVKMALDIARGMNYLHTCTPLIIHRDLKSLNLLLVDKVKGPTDEGVSVKVSDFGLSRVRSQSHADKMTGQCGTYHWMAPEVIAMRPYSEKADVFSYAIVLWEIASRRVPYEGMDPVQIGVAVINEQLRPDISYIPADCPVGLTSLIVDCWQQDPQDRPDFDSIIETLKQIRC
eukprot:GILJ01007769.1.p1 GENE.GILJ01007769.1~~GILJ01007769.1.p1  ORF type:complete len:1687 (-),score=295.75 GILJ01007769.1:212-5272(-)